MLAEGLNKPEIIKIFKRNGHSLSPQAFDNVIEYLCAQEEDTIQQKLTELIDKMNDLSILSSDQINEEMVKACIASTSFGKTLVRAQDFMQTKFRQSVFAISPYQFTLKQVLTENPPAHLFAFEPAKRSQSYIRKLQKAQRNVKKNDAQIIGLVSQRYDSQYKDLQMYVQTYNNQIKLDTSQLRNKCPFIIEGCIYVFKGEYKGRNLTFFVTQILLPMVDTIPFDFNLQRFNEAYKKAGVTYQNYDQLGIVKRKLACYGVNYFQNANSESAVLILGDVTVNPQSVERISYILQNVPQIRIVILLLSEFAQTDMDLNFGSRTVYIIPNAENDEGPMVFPRIPICKNNFKGATILTNPCKMSLFGVNTTFINYRLFNHLSSQTVMKGQQIIHSDKLKHVGQFLYGQGNLISGLKYYWAQEQYMDIKGNQVLMISDQSIPQGQLKLDKGGNIVSVGHFDREKSFIMYFPGLEKNQIQASKL